MIEVNNPSVIAKAKAVENNEWVEGYYYKLGDSDYIMYGENSFISAKIIPETLCFFTGAVDSNGKRIFSRDVIRSYNVFGEYESTDVVNWSTLFSAWHSGAITTVYGRGHKYLVLGNLIDNPALEEIIDPYKVAKDGGN